MAVHVADAAAGAALLSGGLFAGASLYVIQVCESEPTRVRSQRCVGFRLFGARNARAPAHCIYMRMHCCLQVALPARRQLDPAAAVAVFRASYPRSQQMQRPVHLLQLLSTALLCCVAPTVLRAAALLALLPILPLSLRVLVPLGRRVGEEKAPEVLLYRAVMC